MSTTQTGASLYNRSVRATCRANRPKLTGGGCLGVSYVGGYGTGGAAWHKSYPSGGNTWNCEDHWAGTPSTSGPAPRAYAICCR